MGQGPEREESKPGLSDVEHTYHPGRRMQEIVTKALVSLCVAYPFSLLIKPSWPDRFVQSLIESLPIGK